MDRLPGGADFDLNTASPARVYDFFLGGSQNFECDRRMAAKLAEAMPDIGLVMRANRSFLRRAVQFVAGAGIRQFLDLGSGIPTVGNVHEVARRSVPDARVVYVDIDPVAVAHSRAVLGADRWATVLPGDLRDPDRVLAEVALAGTLDLAEPIALLLVGVLHQLPGVDPAKIIAGYRSAMAPGSYLVLSQASQDGRPEATTLRDVYNREYASTAQMTLRSRAETLPLFDAFDLVEPGLVQLDEWRPDDLGAVGTEPGRLSTYAGLGRLR